MKVSIEKSDPGATRTRDPQLRRLLLYPLSYGANGLLESTKNSPPKQ
jgi:hypothetical protein